MKTSATTAFKAFAASTELADNRQVKVLVSTDQVDRMGDIIVQDGIDLSNFKNTRTVLWNHDQDHPIATCLSIGIEGGKLVALTQFPKAGVSTKADEVYGLIQDGIINAASIGFLPLDGEAVDGKNPNKGMRITKSELLEFSFVSVPANPGAVIEARAMRPRTKTMMTARLKSIYDVSNFAYLLAQLGYMAQDAAYEREWEGDDSDIPERIADLCRQGADIFLAMSEEEIGELLATLPGADASAEAQVKRIKGLAKSMGKAMGKAVPSAPRTKAGRKFSAASIEAMTSACDKMMEGHKCIADAHDMVRALVDDDSSEDNADEEDDEGDDQDDDNNTDKSMVATQERRRRHVQLLALT